MPARSIQMRSVVLATTLAACLAMHAPTHAQVPAPTIAARAYVLYDPQSGQLLAEQAANDRFEPASLTKVMTAYLVFKAIRDKKLDSERLLPISERAWRAEGSRMFVDPKKSVSVGDLLRGLIVQSGNDAAIALAEGVAGSEETFVQWMNLEAKRLGLANTQFVNSTGLPQAGHYSSAADMAVLAAALIRDFPADYPLYKQREFRYNNITQANRNRLLWQDPYVDGMKTGHTEAAGYCLIASAARPVAVPAAAPASAAATPAAAPTVEGTRRLVSVVLGATSDSGRAQESQKLLNHGFLFFESQRLFQKEQAVAQPVIYKGKLAQVKLGFERDIWFSLPKEHWAGVKSTLVTSEPLLAPLARGQKAGIMKLTRGDKLIAEWPVVALEDVPVAGVLGRGWDALRLLFR